MCIPGSSETHLTLGKPSPDFDLGILPENVDSKHLTGCRKAC